MKLDRLFLESDARIRMLQRHIQAHPGDQEAMNQYVEMVKRSGINFNNIAADDEAVLKCADYLEKIINQALVKFSESGWEGAEEVPEIIDEVKQYKGDYYKGSWNEKLDEIARTHSVSAWAGPEENYHKIWQYVYQIVALGDLYRSVHKPLPQQSRKLYLKRFMEDHKLGLDDLIKIAYL